ncbi:MAG: DinB family protein [bacterium]
MIRTVEDFLTVWKQEAASTTKLFGALTDESLRQSINDEHRDLGRLAWHITVTIREMMERTGLPVVGPDPHSLVPASAAEIVHEYGRSAESLSSVLGAWTDATLDEEDNLYGEPWRRALTLQILLLHQTHHRGQMTVLMRQAGLSVPGMYGPSKEDWSKFGMPIPVV